MRTRLVITLLCLVPLVACTPGGHPPPRDPGKVLPVNRFSVPGQLYAVKGRTLYRFSGTQMTAVTRDVAVIDPAVTLDGAGLAYVQLDRDRSTIVFRGGGLQAPQAISPSDGAVWAFGPAFAPDGRSFAYLTDRGKRGGPPDLAIWRFDMVRNTVRQLTHPNPYTGGDNDPVWRPEFEDQLLYTRYGFAGEPAAPVARLTWLSVTSGRTVFLSPASGRVFHPSVSPDGRFLAFVRAGAGSDDLYVMSLAESYSRESEPHPTEGATLLQTGMVAHPVWAPDGSAVAFLMLASGSFDLYLVQLSTEGGLRPVGLPIALTRGSFLDADSRLAWGP